MSKDFHVARYSRLCPITRWWSGDFLQVGETDLGGFRDLIEAEYRRAAEERPDNPAFAMRPMFFTGSPFGAEILALARIVRPSLVEATA